MSDHVHVFRESREVRNRRIAIEAVDLIRSIIAGQTVPAAALDAFQRRWEARGVTWLRPAMPFDPDDWLPATEMSQRADVEPSTVRRWHLRGHITAETVNGVLHYNVGEVVAYLAKRDRKRRNIA